MVIRREDFVTSIADALQHISYFHPPDYVRALADAYRREESPAARDAIASGGARAKLDQLATFTRGFAKTT